MGSGQKLGSFQDMVATGRGLAQQELLRFSGSPDTLKRQQPGCRRASCGYSDQHLGLTCGTGESGLSRLAVNFLPIIPVTFFLLLVTPQGCVWGGVLRGELQPNSVLIYLQSEQTPQGLGPYHT